MPKEKVVEGEVRTAEPEVVAEAQNESLELMRMKNDRALQSYDKGPFDSVAAYRHYLSIAETFAASIFVPEAFRGKPGNCLIAFNLAKSMNEDPLRVMQSVYVVGGRPAFYTEFMVARANRLAGFKSHIRWRVEELKPPKVKSGNFELPNLRVTAFAIDEFGDEISESVTTEMAIADGWTKNPKYNSLTERMLKWRSASAFIRMYCPDVMFGMMTAEEAMAEVPGQYQVFEKPVTAASLAAGVGQAAPNAENSSESPPLNFGMGIEGGGPRLQSGNALEPERAFSEEPPAGGFLPREAVAKLKLRAKTVWGAVNHKVDLERTFLALLEEMGIEGSDRIPTERYDEVCREIGLEA